MSPPPLVSVPRVTGCTDLDVLSTWLDRSLSLARAEELFADG
ncbi:hypothetical protein [Streptomyces ardesiacus]|nr:hypothetical protein [Streptomyces ardesiacus]